MSSLLKTEKRRWPTTIISAIVAVASLYAAVIVFKPEFTGILAAIALGAFGALAVITAIEGKPKTLRWLFDSLFYLS